MPQSATPVPVLVGRSRGEATGSRATSPLTAVARMGETRSIRSAIEVHLGSRQVSRVIYGSIIGLALVVVLEAHPPSTGVIVASLLATAVAVAVAEIYSEVVGVKTRTRERIDRVHAVLLLRDAVAVGFGIVFPSIFFVLAALGALEMESAFSLAKWSGLGLIGAYGFCAARLTGAGLAIALLHAVAVASAGALLVAVKALLH